MSNDTSDQNSGDATRGGHHRGFGAEGPRGFGPFGGHSHGFGQGGPFGPGGPFAGRGPGAAGFGPGRKRKGDVRVAILSLLAIQPFNGYGLIKEISERTGGEWRPSPGSIYPTLQQLVEEDLIESVGEGRKTAFVLTEDGTAWTALHADDLEKIWSTSTERAEAEAGMQESIGRLMQVLMQLRSQGTEEQRARAVELLDSTRKALYGILAE